MKKNINRVKWIASKDLSFLPFGRLLTASALRVSKIFCCLLLKKTNIHDQGGALSEYR